MARDNAKWKPRPGKQEIESAFNYLSLLFQTERAKRLASRARRGQRIERVAKDILRASNLPLLPKDERHVEDDLKKIRKGRAIAPIILVQGDMLRGVQLVIADGYHRLCAACHANEDAPVAAILVELD